MTQLRGQTRFARSSRPCHHGHRQIWLLIILRIILLEGDSLGLGGTFNRPLFKFGGRLLFDDLPGSHRPPTQRPQLTTRTEGHYSIPGLNKLQRSRVLRQRNIGGDQHSLGTHHRGQVDIVGPPTAQTADVDAQIPFPVPDVISTLGKGSVPLPSRPS